jgi:hypothetical protein
MQHIICRSPNKCLIIEFHKWSYRPDRIAVEVYVNSYSAPGSVRAQMAYYRAFPETMAQNVQPSANWRCRFWPLVVIMALAIFHKQC